MPCESRYTTPTADPAAGHVLGDGLAGGDVVRGSLPGAGAAGRADVQEAVVFAARANPRELVDWGLPSLSDAREVKRFCQLMTLVTRLAVERRRRRGAPAS